MIEDNKAFIRRWFEEVWNKGREEAIDEMFAAEGVANGLVDESGQPLRGPEGFKPGGMSLHNSMVPHGPDTEAFDKATNAELAPHKLDDTLAFMFESRWRFHPTEFALGCGAIDSAYADCWRGLKDQFK